MYSQRRCAPDFRLLTATLALAYELLSGYQDRVSIWMRLVHENTSSRRNAMNEEQHSTSEHLAMEAEPWEEWEGKLVKYSLLIGVAALIVLGTLVNVFILS